MSPLQWLLVLAPLVMLFGSAARRLLGVRKLSGTRTLLAGVVGMSAAWLIALALERRGASEDTVLIGGVVLAVVFTMVAIVILEFLARSPRRRRGWSVPKPISAVRRRIETYRRAAAVTSIAVRHGLGPLMGIGRTPAGAEYSAQEIGRRTRAALEEAGGVFIKAGQLLATRDDVIPAEVAHELVALQHDAVPEERRRIEPAIR